MKSGIEKSFSFDESAWTKISLMLPDDEELKKAVLDDFMWFINRPKKYRSNKEKVEDYIRHLRLKGNSKFFDKNPHSCMFAKIEMSKILSALSHQ